MILNFYMKERVKFNIGSGSECPHCKIGTINVMRGKWGNFYGCSRYPYCAFSQKLEIQEEEIDDSSEEAPESYLVFN